jgi:hypothetical protein
MESEPEFYDGFEPELGVFQELARGSDPALQVEFVSEPALEAHNNGYATNVGYPSQGLENMQGGHNAFGAYSFAQACASPCPTSDEQHESRSINAQFTCENGYDGGNYDEQYLGDCQSVAEAYSNLISSMGGENISYCGECGYEDYSGFANLEDPSILGNVEGHYYGHIPQTYVMPEPIPHADIHQVLEELNALKPALQSIPRLKRNYVQYHNTLAKFVCENENDREKRVRREDFSRLLGGSVPQLGTPAKATAINKVPRAPASHARMRPNLHQVPAIDRNTMAKVISRKCMNPSFHASICF